MKHLIVYAHPNTESLNRAILDTTAAALKKQGHEVIVRDLYELDFQPVLKPQDTAAMRVGDTPQDIKTEQELITQADAVTFIYPIWWTGLPAILKGYIDRVFAYNFAYRSGDNGIVKMLSGKKGLIINTHGTPAAIYDRIGMSDALRATATVGILDFVGIESVGHLLFGSIGYLDEAGYADILRQVDETVTSVF
ncbi:NAD(P)H-dependent oxidoreductase [Saccharibacillus sp. CPCC 101409]|uniref:NAD(P)H-dependent oxidoreductase n=1 Tax=Saccharibacillus sp. CPCC 101409 TaxID=3058041 RepID=UPI002671F126|nr:NAD(P)H-dependent oxidoreductase [Saccharibacillus sp. CPCC 101409]MDO3413262.1 NAD(P)H-dependent oxidoreductase [Saccharibacillus sp. CPCC 101409]